MRVSARWCFPEIAFGVTAYGAAFTGAVTISEGTLRSLVVEICAALQAQGFAQQVIVNSHFEPAHVAALREAAASGRAGFLDLTRRVMAEQLTEEFRSGAAHAGRYETSMVLASHPELVDSEVMRALPPVPLNMPAAMASGQHDFIAMGMDQAYCGAPAEATAAEGEATLATLTGMLITADPGARRGGPPRVIRAADLDDLNLAARFLDRNVAGGRGDRTALIAPGGACTYAELSALTNQAGNALLEIGVRPQDRVLLALADSVEFVAAWYAAQKIGAVTAEVYTFLQPKDYAYYLDYTRATVVVVDTPTLERMRAARDAGNARPILLVVGAAPGELRDGEVGFEAVVARQPTTLVPAPANRDTIAIWKFTTGSTGRPKACVHAVRSPLVSYEGYARGVLGIRSDDVVLPVPKLFFGYARDLTALFPFGAGGAGIVFPDRPTPELLFALIARHRPTILVNVPTMMQAMLDHPDAARQDLSCLRLCTSAGEALPEPLHRRWIDTFGVEVLDGIGSSEAYHIYVSNRPGRSRPGSIGEVVPGYVAAVVDDDGEPVADGGIGRLWVRGESAALMYWGDAEASRRTFGPDLVMSGDLVERDGGGFFVYRGRADDLLKVGGIWVAPAEIERCLAGHPDVVECAVVAADHDGLTRGCAWIVARGGTSPTVESIQAFVRERLAPHKVPREVRFTDVLPRTGSGKIDRRALRELAVAPPTGDTGEAT